MEFFPRDSSSSSNKPSVFEPLKVYCIMFPIPVQKQCAFVIENIYIYNIQAHESYFISSCPLIFFPSKHAALLLCLALFNTCRHTFNTGRHSFKLTFTELMFQVYGHNAMLGHHFVLTRERNFTVSFSFYGG